RCCAAITSDLPSRSTQGFASVAFAVGATDAAITPVTRSAVEMLARNLTSVVIDSDLWKLQRPQVFLRNRSARASAARSLRPGAIDRTSFIGPPVVRACGRCLGEA